MPDASYMITALIVILGSIALHEFAHAKSADSYGDPTPRSQGRVTLNPLAHLDPLGTIMIVITVVAGFGIGWGKPVMVDPRKMENPRWDHLFSVLWGPLTNLIIAVSVAFIFRVLIAMGLGLPQFALTFVEVAVFLNLALAVFNMIPIGPLDGHWILGILLPPELGYKFMRWSQTQGSIILLAIIFFGPYINFRPIQALFMSVVYPAGKFLLGI